jgi:hypothetical protein
MLKGFPPIFALDFFTLLALVEKNLGTPDKYSTHPPALERLSEIIRKIEKTNDRQMLQGALGMWDVTRSVPGPHQFREYFASEQNKRKP